MGSELRPGAKVTWMHKPRGGYGYQVPVDAEVVRVLPQRVLIEVWTTRGEVVQRWVRQASLVQATEV